MRAPITRSIRRLREAELAPRRHFDPGSRPRRSRSREAVPSSRGSIRSVETPATRLADADEHRRRHEDVLAALRCFVGREVSHRRGTSGRDRRAAASPRPARTRGARCPRSRGDLSEARKARRTTGARRGRPAEKLGVEPTAEPAGAARRGRCSTRRSASAHSHEERERASRARTSRTTERTARELEGRRRELAAREPEWREHDARATRLGEHLGAPARRSRRASTAHESLSATSWRRPARAEEVRSRGPGAADPRGARARRRGRSLRARAPAPQGSARSGSRGGELRGRRSRRGGRARSPARTARAGPRGRRSASGGPCDASAARRRSRTCCSCRATPTSRSWPRAASPLEDGAPDVLVEEGLALRVSRIPDRPRLGRRAREARAAELRAEAEAKARELDEVRAKRRLLERLVRRRRGAAGRPRGLARRRPRAWSSSRSGRSSRRPKRGPRSCAAR